MTRVERTMVFSVLGVLLNRGIDWNGPISWETAPTRLLSLMLIGVMITTLFRR